MTIAVSPDGGVVYFDADAGSWVPSQVAKNPGGDSVAFDGKDWVPVKLPQKEQAPVPQRATSIGGAFQGLLDDPGPLSVVGTIKHLVTTPSRMMQNLQNVQQTAIPAEGGTWTEADEFRRQLAAGQLQGSAMDIAALGPMSRAATPFVKSPVPQAPALPKPASPLLESAENIGVPIPRVLATESVPVQRAGSAISQAPLVGEPIVNAVRGTTEGLGNAATRIERELGAGSPEVAGAAAKSDIASWLKGASRDMEEAAHNAVRDLVSQNVETPLSNAAGALASIGSRRANAALGETPIAKELSEALSRPGLNYEGIKDLRTSFGPKAKAALIQRGIDTGEAKLMYGALSKDLETAIKRAGGEKAVEAWRNANAQSVKIKGQQDRLASVVGLKGEVTAEKVFDRIMAMASGRQRADMQGLKLVRSSIGDKAWNEVGSAIVSNMGRDAQGAFSPERFLGPNGYGRLSDGAKDILFNPQHRKALDDIATVSAAIKDKISAFENRSRTGGTIIGAAGLTGMIADPITTVASALGGKVLAEYLSQPVAAKAVADVVKAQARVIEVPGAAADQALQLAVRKLMMIGNAMRMPAPQPERAQ